MVTDANIRNILVTTKSYIYVLAIIVGGKRTLVYIKRINGQFSVATSTETNIFFNNLFHNHFLLRISTIIFFRHAPAKDACRGCLLEVYIQRILSIHPARCIYTSNAPHLYIRQGGCPFFQIRKYFC